MTIQSTPEQPTPAPVRVQPVVRLPRLKRGEYWVLVLLNNAGKTLGNTGGIIGKTMNVPPTLAFKNCTPGVFESAEHGVVIYRQPNDRSMARELAAPDSATTNDING